VDVHYITRQDTGLVLVGQGGRERWVFKAVAPGETEIKLKYVRPWEKDAAPEKEAGFRIRVNKS